MSRTRLRDILYGAALAASPWVGLDPVRLLTGRDLGAGFQPSYLLLAAAMVAALAAADRAGLRDGWRDARPWGPLAAATVAVVLLSAAGLFVAPPLADPGLGPRGLRFLKQGAQLLVMFCFVGFPLAWTRGEARWEWTRRLFAVALLGQLAYGMAQGLAFPHPPAWFAALERVFTSNPAILSGSEELYLGRGFTGIPRLRGTACEPLYLGGWLLLALPVLLLPGAARRYRATALAGGLLLLLTWSRGAWLGASVAAVAWFALSRRAGAATPAPTARPARRRWLLVGGLVLVALAVAAAWPAIVLLPLRRLAQSASREDWSNLTRLYSLQAGWRAFLLSPWLGVGWGQFGFHFAALVDPLGLQSQFSWPVVNCYPLEILCETGVAGFAVFAAGALRLGRAVVRATRGVDAAPGALAARRRVALLAAATAGVWSQTLTYSQYNLPHLWIVLGLLLAALRETETTGA